MGRWAVLLLVSLSSCASQPLLPPGAVHLTAADHDRFEAAALEGASLRARIAALEEAIAQLRVADQRLHVRTGLAAFQPRIIKPMPGGPQAATLSTVTVVASPGAKGQSVSLKKRVASSRAVIFSFWATWCVPCTSTEELAHLRELRHQLRRHGMDLVSMAIDDLEKVQGDDRAGAWLYPLYFKKAGHIDLLPQSFIEASDIGLPLFLVVAQDGAIHYVHQNKLSAESVAELVDAALSIPIRH